MDIANYLFRSTSSAKELDQGHSICNHKRAYLDPQAPRKSLTYAVREFMANIEFRSTSSAKELDGISSSMFQIMMIFRSTSSAKELD